MFEQSLYEPEYKAPEPDGEALEPGSFLSGYEIKAWDWSPRFLKLAGGVLVFNILLLVGVAQTSLLTMKGCDSPLVGRVCQVLDTVYVGAVLFGTDREFVDVAYNKTSLDAADEVTFVDVSGDTGPLDYPLGYFQIANPEEHARRLAELNSPTGGLPTQTFTAPGVPTAPTLPRPSTGRDLTNTRPRYPKANPGAIAGKLPDVDDLDADTAGDAPKGKGGTQANGKPGKKPDDGSIPGFPGLKPGSKPADNPTDPNRVVASDPMTGYEFNRRPLIDLANTVNEMLQNNQVRLDSQFVVTASGKLTKDGRLDPKSFRWGQTASNDPKMIEVVKEAIEALNDSGYLQYLSELSGKDFGLAIQQDDSNVIAQVQSEMESDTRARSIQSALNLLINGAKSRKSGENADQNDRDDLILLENARVEVEGKKLFIRFAIPKSVALPMIQRKLAEQRDAPKQPNSNAIGRNRDNLARR